MNRLADGGCEYRLDLRPLESLVLVDGDGERLPERSAASAGRAPGRRGVGAHPARTSGDPAGGRSGPVDRSSARKGSPASASTPARSRWMQAFLRGRRILAAFGDVGDIAQVLVNGIDCGITWTVPFEADVTGALRPGRNAVVVEVANAWMNRLIAEARHPTGEIFGTGRRRLRAACRDPSGGPERSRRAPGLRLVNRVEELLRSMTWDEKLAQMQVVFRPDPAELDRWVRAGVGATFWPRSAAAVNALQRVAVEQTRLGIPLLIGLDVIHGQRTMAPTPLAMAASFDPGMVERTRPARRSGSGFGRSELDVLPHDRCQPGSSLGPGGRGFRGRPVPDGRDGRGDDPRLPGRRSPRAGQHRGDGEALRRLRPRRGRPGLQHGRHVRTPSPERLPGTLPRRHCRRSRIGDGRVQYDRRQADARAPAPADRCPQGRVGYARRHRRRRGRRRQPGPARCRHRPARRGAAVGAGGSRHRDGRQPDG